MSEDAIEIVAFPDDENVNLLNYAPTSPRGGTKIGGVNSIAKALDGLKQALSPKSAAVALKLGSPKNLAVSPASPAAAAPAWAHQKSPRTLSPKSPDGIMKFRAVSPKFEDVDEIMAFRAGSCDSDTVDETQHVTETTAPEQQPANPVTVPEDCMNIESLRVLPTIMEAGTEDSTDNILSHPGTECASIKSSSSGEDADCSVEVLDDGSILAGTGKPESSVRSNPKKAVNLKVNVHGEQAVDEIADLDQMLSDLNDPFEGPFSPLVGENILLSPVFNQKASLVQADTTASPRRALSPRQIENTASPRGVLSPRQSTDPTSPRATLSPRNAVTPTSPGRCQEPSEQIVSPRQRQDPPSLLQEVSEEIISRRITFKTAVAEATHLKKQLDEQMSRTQEFSSKVMAKREAEAKRQKDLEKELAEVARHNEALQAEIKKLAVTKKELQEAKLEVEKEETELKQLREEHKAKCGELEKELMIENDALRSDIEKLVVTKKELIDAKFKAQKEESDLALKKKEYEDQLQLYEAEKQKLEAAMEKATIETNETNELSKKVLKELKEHKDNVEADLDLVKEMHNSQMKILMEERPKLQAATTKAEQEIAEAKANTSRILRELEEMTQKEEAEVAKLCAEHENRMKVLEREKEELANAIEQAANETTETKEMTRAVLSELEEYKMKLEVDMQNEIKDLKNEIRELEEDHEKTMEKLVERSEALQIEITSEQNEVQEMVKEMELSIEKMHQKKENMENELTLRIESVNQSTKESKRELQQELNKARFSKAKNRFDKMRGHAKESLKCASVDMISYSVESFTQAAYEAITEPFSDDLLIKQANSTSFTPPKKKGAKKSLGKIPPSPSRGKIIASPKAQSKGITRQTSSSSLQGKVISPREILL